MSAASTEDMVKMIPELASVDSGTITLFLDDAALMITDVDEDNAAYNALHRYMTAHLMTGAGLVKGDSVTSERVADVSVTYQGPQSDTKYADKWEAAFFRLLSRIIGPDERIY